MKRTKWVGGFKHVLSRFQLQYPNHLFWGGLHSFPLRQKSSLQMNRKISWDQQPPNMDDYGSECFEKAGVFQLLLSVSGQISGRPARFLSFDAASSAASCWASPSSLCSDSSPSPLRDGCLPKTKMVKRGVILVGWAPKPNLIILHPFDSKQKNTIRYYPHLLVGTGCVEAF